MSWRIIIRKRQMSNFYCSQWASMFLTVEHAKQPSSAAKMFWLLSFVMSIQAVKCCLSIDGDDARQSHLLALKANFYDDFTCSLFHLTYIL